MLISCFPRSDTYVQVDFRIPSPAAMGSPRSSDGRSRSSADGVFVAARVFQAGCWLQETTGLFLFIHPGNQTYTLAQTIGNS